MWSLTVEPFYLTLFMGTPIWLWLTFLALVAALLAFDLGVLNRKEHEIGVAESLRLSAFYITLGVLFGGFVWYQLGAEPAAEYMTAFVVEKTLAMDNVFVIALIFATLSIPRRYQHRVLFWGILGVIVLRGLMIGLGATLVSQYSWVLYHADRRIQLDPLHLRRLPDPHRLQDAVRGRQGT